MTNSENKVRSRATLAIHLPAREPDDPGDWQHLLDRAIAADRAGVDRLVVTDHVVFGDNLEAYSRPELGGRAGGRQPTGPDGYWLEPLTVLSVVCGLTSRVRLMTTILLAALRRPVVLAKVGATLDVLSGGRLDLGVGVGWQRAEYEAAGLDFAARGRLLDDTLGVLRTLWRDNPASFESETVSLERVHMMPKPTQPGGVPIWVSGTLNERVIGRLIRYGDGWIPWGPQLDDPVDAIEVLRRRFADAGRDPEELAVLGTLTPVRGSDGHVDLAATLAPVASLAAHGVTDFRVNLPVPLGLDAASDYLADVVARFGSVSGGTAA